MSIVRTLIGFRPPPRYMLPATPWTRAKVDEGLSATGPWSQIDDQALSPLDSDPVRPALRNFTVTTAQNPEGWYRIRFVDADGNWQATPATFGGLGGTLPPSLSDLRLRSPLLRKSYPDDPYEPAVEEEFATARDAAIGMVQSWTARILDPSNPQSCATTYASKCEPTPGGLVPIAVRAVTLVTEMIAVSSEAKLARQRGGRLRLRSFTAGPYSETYWDPGMVRGGSAGRPLFVDEPDLNDLIWALATEEAKATLIMQTTGQLQPGAAVQSFNWRGRSAIDQRVSGFRSRRGY